jgi:hypothetical protein
VKSMKKTAKYTVLILFASISCVAQTDAARATAWANVLKAQDAATAAQDQEEAASPDQKEGPHEDRVRLFGEAVSLLAQYMTQFQPDPTTVTYLRLVYRRGIYEEAAENHRDAITDYLKCQAHPKYHDPAAQYDGKQIDQLVRERLLVLRGLYKQTKPIVDPPTNLESNGGFHGTFSGLKPAVLGADSTLVHVNPHDLAGANGGIQRSTDGQR